MAITEQKWPQKFELTDTTKLGDNVYAQVNVAATATPHKTAAVGTLHQITLDSNGEQQVLQLQALTSEVDLKNGAKSQFQRVVIIPRYDNLNQQELAEQSLTLNSKAGSNRGTLITSDTLVQREGTPQLVNNFDLKPDKTPNAYMDYGKKGDSLTLGPIVETSYLQLSKRRAYNGIAWRNQALGSLTHVGLKDNGSQSIGGELPESNTEIIANPTTGEIKVDSEKKSGLKFKAIAQRHATGQGPVEPQVYAQSGSADDPWVYTQIAKNDCITFEAIGPSRILLVKHNPSGPSSIEDIVYDGPRSLSLGPSSVSIPFEVAHPSPNDPPSEVGLSRTKIDIKNGKIGVTAAYQERDNFRRAVVKTQEVSGNVLRRVSEQEWLQNPRTGEFDRPVTGRNNSLTQAAKGQVDFKQQIPWQIIEDDGAASNANQFAVVRKVGPNIEIRTPFLTVQVDARGNLAAQAGVTEADPIINMQFATQGLQTQATIQSVSPVRKVSSQIFMAPIEIGPESRKQPNQQGNQ